LYQFPFETIFFFFKLKKIMSVTFKKVLRKDPFHKDGTGKYYPQLIVWGKSATLESIAVQMKESSSLTLGDIQSVITNFVGAMRRELFNGRSVNIDNFGVFSLSATTEGSEKKDDCQSTKIRSVRINFRASSSIRPQVAATRAEDRMDFVDLESQLKAAGSGSGGGAGGGNSRPGGPRYPRWSAWHYCLPSGK